MLLVRDVFRLKFGKAREAVAAWKDMSALMEKNGFQRGSYRLLTDLVGPYYTLVMETSVPSLAEWEAQGRRIMADDEWRKQYGKLTPFIESGYREVFNIVE